MALDSTRKATQAIADATDEVLKEAIEQGASVDVIAICTMLKLLIGQLGALTITMAEKKCQR